MFVSRRCSTPTKIGLKFKQEKVYNNAFNVVMVIR